ncbi:hypothetical protein PV797_04460 [Clostridiaceae bacterium M8S5]|nr:hypothetical protein PV797_04460 [Clostridiaceae bacterium M8S5]
MGSSFSKVIAIIITCILLFVFPMMTLLERQDDTSRIYVLAQTTKLVDSVRNLGYISTNMYREFCEKLYATDNVYEIQMEHFHKNVDPVYIDTTDSSMFCDDININYIAYYTENITNAINNSNNENKKYYFTKGDYFTVKVVNKNKTIATRLKDLVYNTCLPNENISIYYGGMVQNETN